MDYGHKWTERELKKLEKRISAEYNQAEKEIEKKLEKYLADFVRKDAVKQQQLAEKKITPEEYEKWVFGQIMIGTRWQELQDNLAADLQKTNEKTASMTKSFSYDAYAANFNYGTFEAEKGSGVDTAFTLYDRNTVERLIRDDPDMLPPPGKRVSKKIAEKKAELWNKQQIQSVMTQSILQGESIKTIAKRLESAVGPSYTKEDIKDWERKTAKQVARELARKNKAAAIRNARTMTTGAENAGRLDSYIRAENMGIELRQQWLAAHDTRTRHEHRQLDGQIRPVNKPFETGEYKIRFPGDPQAAPEMVYNCRCTLVAIVEGSKGAEEYEELNKTAKIRNSDMTYEQWKHQHDRKQKTKTVEIPAPDNAKSAIVEIPEWLDRIHMIQASKAAGKLTELEIKEAGQLMQEQIKPLKEQFSAATKQNLADTSKALSDYEEIRNKYAKVTTNVMRISDDIRYSGEMHIKYKDMSEGIKAKVNYKLLSYGYDINISDDDTGMDIINKLHDKYTNAYYQKSVDAYNKYNKLVAERNAIWPDYAAKLKTELAKVRTMGIQKLDVDSHLVGSSPMRKTVIQAYDYYPTDWIEASINEGYLSSKKVKRGYYDHASKIIAISGNSDEKSIETAIHELGHRFERTQDLLQYEKQFYDERTTGEQLKWLGPGYKKEEKARFDDFIKQYMGKDYGGYAYELCSMGFEYAFTHPDALEKDPDMESWIFGMLAVC